MTRAAGRCRRFGVSTRRQRRSNRSTGAPRPRTPRRTCRPSRSRAAGRGPGGRRGSRWRSCRPGRPASRSPKPARLTVASSSTASGSAGSPMRAPIASTSASSATLRPSLDRNQAAIPVASPTTACGTPRRSSPRSRHRRLSEGAREAPQDDGCGGALRVPGRLAGLAGLVDPADRFVLGSKVAGIHAGEVVESPGATRRDPRRAARRRPARARGRASSTSAEPKARVDGHDLAGRLHLAAERPVGAGELVEREAGQLDHDIVERGLEGGHGRARHDVRDLGQAPSDGDLAATRAIGSRSPCRPAPTTARPAG